jgi:hypothetical protein
MPQRVAKVEQEYAGRAVKVGEAFDVDQQDVQLLLDMGRIERGDEDSPPPFYQVKVPTPSPIAATGSYATREMRPNRRGSRA